MDFLEKIAEVEVRYQRCKGFLRPDLAAEIEVAIEQARTASANIEHLFAAWQENLPVQAPTAPGQAGAAE